MNFMDFRSARGISLVSAFMVLVLYGCGGGGGSSDRAACVSGAAGLCNSLYPAGTAGTGSESGSVATAASVQFLVSSQQLNSAGTSPVLLTVVARDANGQALAGRPVQFKMEDPENAAYVSDFSQTSGTVHATSTSGQLTAALNIGNNKANRTIRLTASVDGASASNVVAVSGTTLAVSGSNALVFGASTQLNVVLTDSAGKPIPSSPLTVASSTGNTVALSAPVTDATGKAVVTVTGNKSGTDTLNVSGAGASAAYQLTVSGNGFAFTSPAAGAVSAIGTPITVSIRWTNNGQPVVGQTINFATTRGNLSASQVTTNARGEASVTLTSSSAGPATVTASGPASSGVAGSTTVIIVSAKPAASLDLQADKTTIGINPPGSSNNFATLTAVVRDIDNYRVAGVLVNFHIDQDSTGGALSAATAVTDSNGIAKIQYIPTSTQSPTNGVVISAAVAGLTLTTRPVVLTVASQNLFVRIGTDNLVGTAAGSPNYTKQYSAFVTDAAGNPVPNATVQFLIRPRQDIAYSSDIPVENFLTRSNNDFAYYKGTYEWDVTQGVWTPIRFGCYNEDINFNGIIFDSKEDWNKNGVLDPGNVFSVNADVATNNAGYAVATITYPKDRANWNAVTLKATAMMSGTEATATTSFTLPVAAADISTKNATPPGFISPYGIVRDCTSNQ
jgi:hypothetical protein